MKQLEHNNTTRLFVIPQLALFITVVEIRVPSSHACLPFPSSPPVYRRKPPDDVTQPVQVQIANTYNIKKSLYFIKNKLETEKIAEKNIYPV